MLYKFLELDTVSLELDNQIEKILVQPTLKFTPLSKLNDPNEFKFFLGFDRAEKDSIRSYWMKTNPGKSDKEFLTWFDSINEDFLRQKETEFRLFRKKSYQICSLSRQHKSNLLWSHYAGGDGGLVVIYKDSLVGSLSTENSIHIYGCVKYKRSPPTIKEYIESGEEINKKIFFTKQQEWEYEKEYRFIQLNGDVDASFLPISPNHIFGVILGINLRSDIMEKINHICTKLRYHCFQVCNFGKEYALDTVEIKNGQRLWFSRI